MNYALSAHASARLQQRGVRRQTFHALMAHADFETVVGGGCTVLRLTEAGLDDPEIAASIGQDLERARRLSVIWNGGTGQIATVLRPRRGANGRRCRRGA
jgi:hypothetical protein